ncbi:MAG: hypothetical protein P1P90_05340 [Patescibacteria group bacterium]|nr:hypothetical protein [Patescibacteria group bacterium]
MSTQPQDTLNEAEFSDNENEELQSDIVSPQPNDEQSDNQVILNAVETKFTLARKMISNLKSEISNLERLLASDAEPADIEQFIRTEAISGSDDLLHPVNEGKIVEGVFDGQNMIGSDGKTYIVPPNYASKSKLVEGDIMKLTIQPNGSFLYKQIGPIERQRVMGVLTKDEVTGDWKVIGEGKKYNILTASITYFKGNNGDDCVVLIPKAAPSKWAAVENIIHRA